MVYVNDDGSITSNAAPRYRLVGYDIGTAPDANGGWVHWADYARLEAEIARLTSEVTQLRADLANAGAVMVEACAKWCADEADRCDDAAKWGGHRKYVQDCKAAAYALRNAASKIRALSTLSPIAAAARVLLADPDTFDGFKGYVLNRNDMDATMSDYAEGAMDYLRALAEQEKADG